MKFNIKVTNLKEAHHIRVEAESFVDAIKAASNFPRYGSQEGYTILSVYRLGLIAEAAVED